MQAVETVAMMKTLLTTVMARTILIAHLIQPKVKMAEKRDRMDSLTANCVRA
jgi:hypothetical protein